MLFKNMRTYGTEQAQAGSRPRYMHKRQNSGSNETATTEISKSASGATTSSVSILQASNVGSASLSSTGTATPGFLEVSQAVSSSVAVVATGLPSQEPAPVDGPSSSIATIAATQASSSISPATIAEPSSTARGLLQAPPAPAPSPEPTVASPNPPIPAIPTTSSSSVPSTQPLPEPKPTSAPAPAPAAPQASSQTTLATSETKPASVATPSSLLIDSLAATAASTSIAAPTILPITTPSAVTSILSSTTLSASGNLAIQSGTSGVTSGTEAAAFGAATGTPSGASANIANGNSNSALGTAAIAGIAVAAVAGIALLAFLSICCIRRRHRRSSNHSFSGFTKRPSSKLSESESPPPMRISFRPDPTSLFGNSRLSRIAESHTRTATPDSYTSLVRHDRSNTPGALTPDIPARSAARLPLGPPIAPLPLVIAHHHQPAVSIDNSFMGTISTYLTHSRRSSQSSTNSSTPSLPNPVTTSGRHLSRSTAEDEHYTISPYTSYLAPPPQQYNAHQQIPRTSAQQLAVAISTNNPFRRLPIATTNTAANTNTYTNTNTNSTILPSPSTSTPLPQITNSPPSSSSSPVSSSSSPSSSTPPVTSRFAASIGPWRDSMWSTSATTPILQNPPGVPSPSVSPLNLPGGSQGATGKGISSYFPSNVVDHTSIIDGNDRYGDGEGEGVIEPPPRSPLRQYWPLGFGSGSGSGFGSKR